MNTAMILCAGLGTRLKHLTNNIPKPMLPVFEKPILEYTIKHLSNCGINNIIINLHYFADLIKNHFGNGKKWGVSINYSYEEELLGTAGGVKNVEKLLSKSNNFLVLYGDVVCNEDYNNLFKAHRNNKSIATIILHERAKSNSIVEMDSSNKIIRFLERPNSEIKDKKQEYVNSGLYCFSNKIFNYIPERAFCDFPKDIFPILVNEGMIYGYPLNRYRCAVDSPERYYKLINDFKNNLVF